MDATHTVTTTSVEEPSSFSYPGLWVGIFGLLLIIIAVIILVINWNNTTVTTTSWWVWILLVVGFLLMIGGFIWYAFSGPDTTPDVTRTTSVSTPLANPMTPLHTPPPAYPYGTLINQTPLVPDQYRSPDGTIYRRETGVVKTANDSFNLVAVEHTPATVQTSAPYTYQMATPAQQYATPATTHFITYPDA